MAFRITVPPTSEPVTLNYVKSWLKQDEISADDEIIFSLLASAREKVEDLSGRALMPQTIEDYFDKTPVCGHFELSRAPVASITSIQYRDDTDGTYQTWNAANYQADLIDAPARIFLDTNGDWPDVGNYPNAWKITYEAGYTSAALVPESLKKAIAAQVCMDYCERQGYDIEHEKYLNSIDAEIRRFRTRHV